jgi:hypothetical protein
VVVLPVSVTVVSIGVLSKLSKTFPGPEDLIFPTFAFIIPPLLVSVEPPKLLFQLPPSGTNADTASNL